MNNFYKIAMVCLLGCISVTVLPQDYFPTLRQWQSFENVEAGVSDRLHKKIVKKRAIKEQMISSPNLTSVKSGIMAALNGWNNLLISEKERLVETYDGWGSDPKLSLQDIDELFVGIIKTGNTIAFEHLMQIVENSSFDIDKRLMNFSVHADCGIYDNSLRLRYYSPLKLAIHYNQLAVADMLISHGAKITPAMITAAQAQHHDVMVEFLVDRATRLGHANIAVGVANPAQAPALGVMVENVRLGYLEENS